MFKVKLETDNSAFEDDLAGEVSRILSAISQKFKAGQHEGVCVGINGNKVGTWKWSA